MVHIASAGNSDTACLRLILFKGYKVRVTYEDPEYRGSHYVAAKGDDAYAAESPMELLGLISLGETWGEDWQRHELGDPYEQIEYEDDEDDDSTNN